ncbi:MAG: copper-translocating P-type ATPase [Candidatus Parcubacteria bacterium]|nr:MAG: copper-translocating P-type ATPase [Candidatus Parcubacteria bacterium]
MKKYICPMGCVSPQNEPGGNCPVCGMRLVEVEEKHRISRTDAEHTEHINIVRIGSRIVRISSRFKRKEYNEHFDKHHGHRAEDFLKKFWLCLILTIFVIFLSFDFLNLNFFSLREFTFSLLKSALVLIFSSIVFFYGGWVFLVGAYREIKSKNPGMMTLISLAITSAYVYSVVLMILNVVRMSLRVSSQEFAEVGFFWELTSLITIMLLGHYFEMKSVSSAQRALQEIEKLLPDTAELESGKIIPLNELKVDDIVLVRPGGKIPADGVVVEGKSEVNESMITGESRPILKEVGSEVITGTINGDGILKIKVTKIGEETFLAGIKRLIQEAQKSKSKLQVLADVFAKYLTFIALGVGSLSFVIWLSLQKDFAFVLERLVTVLVIACPHALGLAVPLVVAISTSLAIHNGFLIRNSLQLELARKVDVVLFDKTGTLTSGKFVVKEIKKLNDISEEKILQIAGSLNQYSQHFIAQGILRKVKEQSISLLPVNDFENLTGRGVKGIVDGQIYYLGGDNLLKELNLKAPEIEGVGTIVYLIDEGKNILGAIILEDEIRKEVKEAVKELHQLGIKVLMVTGDKKEVAEKVAKELGIDEYFAEVLPQEKVEKVKELQQKGLKVMFVGDGINDAPALMQADVGVVIGAGTNVAIESAGIILVRNDPRDIVKLIKLSKLTYRKMIENLFWATGYNVVMIPLAAGIFEIFKMIFSLPGSEFILIPGPAIGSILMSLSTIIVSLNALRMRKI